MTEEGILPLCRPFAEAQGFGSGLWLRTSAQGFGSGLWLRTSAQGQNDTLFVTLRRSRRVSYFLVILRDSISRSVVLRCKPKKLIPIIEKKRFEILHSAIASFRMTEEGILPLCRPFADPSLKLRASA